MAVRSRYIPYQHTVDGTDSRYPPRMSANAEYQSSYPGSTTWLDMLTADALADGTLHIVRARLDRPPRPIAELTAIASPVERARAAKFLHEADSHRHLIGRALARLALARLLDTTPQAIDIRASSLGKLYIENGPSFNISHSGNIIMLALAARGRLGVDVEAVRELRDLPGLARTTFAYDELDAVVSLPTDRRAGAFYRIWTRKEAMLKALGLGLTALDAISVSADPGYSNALLRLDLQGESAADWVVRSLACSPDVETAVAWDQPIRQLTIIDL